MPSNTIVLRVYAFLKEHPPFALLEPDRLEQLAATVRIRYCPVGESLFSVGEAVAPRLYVVREGAVHLWRSEGKQRILADACGEGDLFGLAALFSDQPYPITAEVVEETLLYELPLEAWKEPLLEHPGISRFLLKSVALEAEPSALGSMQWDSRAEHAAAGVGEALPVEHVKAPVSCAPATPVREAASIMTRREVGSIVVVDDDARPLGIVTDKDLRQRVATGHVPLQAPIRSMMSFPVVTMAPAPTVAEALLVMLQHGIRHLVLTESGRTDAPLCGVISQSDLLALQGNDPVMLHKEIGRARTGGALAALRDRAEGMLDRYLQQGLAMDFVSSLMSELNDAMVRRAIALAQQRMDAPPSKLTFCWLAIGSLGRSEQLLRTDQDHALLFQDPDPADDLEQARAQLLELASGVTDLLEEAGFPPCPAHMMARNPDYCLSLSEWKTRFQGWIEQPTPEAVLRSCIFFDLRPVYGAEALAHVLREQLKPVLKRQELFLAHMARHAQDNPPPLTFFRRFVVERSGEHKNNFDIKARAMMPLVDAARVLALQAQLLDRPGTVARFRALAEREPANQDLYLQAAEAYELLLRIRAEQGLRQEDTGRYIDPARLSTMQRLQLRNCFRPIRALQSLLSTRFQTAHFA